MNQELPDVQARFQRGRGTRDQLANIHWIMEKAKEFQKSIYFYIIDYAKNFVWITANCGIFLKWWKYHVICLLRNLDAGQEAAVRTRHGIMDLFQIRKGVFQGCIWSACLYNLYAEYNMWNAGLDESQAGIKIAGRNIKNLRYAEDTTIMGEDEEELKGLFDECKRGEWKTCLEIQHSKI